MESNLFPDDESTATRAALGRRATACVIDYCVMALVFFFSPMVFGVKTGTVYTINGPLALLPLAHWYVYFIVLETVFSGTPGKLLVGIRVKSFAGNPVSLWQVSLRRFADFPELVLCFGAAAYARAKKDHYNRRMGDVWANTIVVPRKSLHSPDTNESAG